MDKEILDKIKDILGEEQFAKMQSNAIMEADSAKKVWTDLIDYMKNHPACDHINIARIGVRVDYLFMMLNDAIVELEKHPECDSILKGTTLGLMFNNINKQQIRFKQFLTRMEII